MTEPFYKADPGDPITADDWNNMQSKMREEVRTHTHKGGDSGALLDGSSISPTATLKVNQVDAAVGLTVKNVDVLERLNALDKQKLSSGGNISGSLSVAGNVGVGTAAPAARLDIQGANRTGTHAQNRALYVTGEFGEADGVEFRHSNGTQGVGIGYNTVYATGTNDNQDLMLKARGSGTVRALNRLEVTVPGTGAWNKLVVNTTAEWGDGNTQFVTIGSGGAAGIMLSNPHVTWRENRASIRYGRSGGVPNGAFWDVGTRVNNAFSVALNGPDDHKLWVSGNGNVGIGTTDPTKKLTVDYAGSTANHATMEVRQTGGNSWGVALVLRTTGGNDGAAMMLRSRNKNWHLRGETGDKATGFQITEDGGDAEYGQGFGTPRLHISAGGNVGIGTTAPGSKLDIQNAPRSGAHPQNRALYVTGEFGEADGVEFRHSNGTQGVGIGYNTLYATGSNPNQELFLQARGTGSVRARVNSAQMVLERSIAQGGKALFLELFQSAGTNPPDVVPSLRFHHAGRHWSRIDATNGCLHFRDGNLAVDDYVDAAARNFYIKSQDALAVASPEQSRIIRGSVRAGGGIVGAGFSAAWIGGGLCDITFSRRFNGPPTVVATQQYTGDGRGGNTLDNAVVVLIDETKARIKTGDGGGNGTNRDFQFIVIGP
ncbi:hypothetical protein JRI60_32310 [Archangium violaceum]|uniref:hypothetical protein n=1 Tax=Archangium violaceum TaxID=83451 RepID=UPI00194EA09F|nr:hypothetical protein [Archangium violaceum]QRN93830.1 hypothetical protein JRI60_32310 [Archangium violaceum]